MSCGDPHEVDCSEVLETVYLYLDGEIDHAELGRIRGHLDECSPCLREYGIEEDEPATGKEGACERGTVHRADSLKMRRSS